MGLSVIIPIGSNDQAWQSLLPDLKFLNAGDEIILVSPDSPPNSFSNTIAEHELSARTEWIQSPAGRARQMNAGARIAKNGCLWFLHCDSRLVSGGISRLKQACLKKPNDLLFFNLDFMDDGSQLMGFNQIGVWFRSRILRLPFGDQGFCLSQETFKLLGGFDEFAPYGEDHLLIWKAHQKKISVSCIGARLQTSSRRYVEHGWLQTTSKHIKLTLQQAVPQLVEMVRERRGGRE